MAEKSIVEAGSDRFEEFLRSKDTLWVCRGGDLLFKARVSGLVPLLTYIEELNCGAGGITVHDRIVGRAAALLLGKASCIGVCAEVGSEAAAQVLRQLDIDYSFVATVPYILNPAGTDMCPFERASIGRTPEEFYRYAKQTLLKG